jgi:polysaccharide export outer membrane protein
MGTTGIAVGVIVSRLTAFALPILLCLPIRYALAQDLPFDPQIVGQMTPEQKQQALQALGAVPAEGDASGTLQPSNGTNSAGLPDVSRLSSEQRRLLMQQLREVQPSQNDYGQRPQGTLTQSIANRERSRFTDLDRGDDQGFDQLKPFGYDLFLNSPSTFAPANDIPVPNDYVIGPGDRLHVQFYGNENQTTTLTVSRDGSINFPKLGPISVAGRKFDDVRAEIEDRVEHEIIGVSVNIGLGDLRSIRVFLLGDVAHAGSYTISSLATVTNALVFGGGVSEVGSLRKIELKRDGRLIRTIDLYKLLLHGDSTSDERLEPGDVIFVPPVGARVAIGGEVKRPAIYELNGETSVADVIQMAGGLLASTDTVSALIAHYDHDHRRSLRQFDLASLTSAQLSVSDGDQIKIRRISTELDNSVFVLGEVKYPGRYEWSSSTTLAQVLGIAEVRRSDSNSQVYLPLGLLERTNAATGARVIQGFNAQGLLAGSASDVKLMPGDRIALLSRTDVNFLDSGPVRKVVAGDFTVLPTPQAPSDQNYGSKFAGNAISNANGNTAYSNSISDADASYPNLANPYKGAAFGPGAAEVGESALQAATSTGHDNQTYSPDLASSEAVGASQEPANVNNCYGLTALAKLLNGERAARYEKAFNYENLRTNRKVENELRGAPCPALYQKMPQALPFLLESSVAVYGEVQFPGLYPVVDHTGLELLLQAAGGTTRETNVDDIEYVSFAEALRLGHSSYSKTTLQAAESASGGFSPGDVINFRPLYSGQEVGNVQAKGEFRFPGAYGILSGERLSELMSRAGGLTPSAYPYGAIFTRSSARDEERAAYQRTAKELQDSLVTAITSGDLKSDAQSGSAPLVAAIVKQLNEAVPLGRIVIESDPTVLALHPEEDPILEPGDLIYMPKRPISVAVVGQVLNSGSLAFKPALSAKQYIAQAGGYSQAADKKRTFVILPNGTAQKALSSSWSHSSIDIPPGSSIVVPRDATPFNGSVFTDRLLGILGNLALLAASLAVVAHNGA